MSFYREITRANATSLLLSYGFEKSCGQGYFELWVGQPNSKQLHTYSATIETEPNGEVLYVCVWNAETEFTRRFAWHYDLKQYLSKNFIKRKAQ